VAMLNSSLRHFYGHHHDLVNRYGISVSQMTADMFRLSLPQSGHFLVHDFTRFWFVTRITQRVLLVEQERLTLLEHLCSTPFFIGVRVARSLVFCVVFCRLLFWSYYLGHCIACPSSFMTSDFSFGIFTFLSYVMSDAAVFVWRKVTGRGKPNTYRR
jgi:hypothetical protein